MAAGDVYPPDGRSLRGHRHWLGCGARDSALAGKGNVHSGTDSFLRIPVCPRLPRSARTGGGSRQLRHRHCRPPRTSRNTGDSFDAKRAQSLYTGGLRPSGQATPRPSDRPPPDQAGRLLFLIAQRLTFGDLRRFGIPPAPEGPYASQRLRGINPAVDDGFIEALKSGDATVVAEVRSLEGADAVLVDGTRLQPDSVITARAIGEDWSHWSVIWGCCKLTGLRSALQVPPSTRRRRASTSVECGPRSVVRFALARSTHGASPEPLPATVEILWVPRMYPYARPWLLLISRLHHNEGRREP